MYKRGYKLKLPGPNQLHFSSGDQMLLQKYSLLSIIIEDVMLAKRLFSLWFVSFLKISSHATIQALHQIYTLTDKNIFIFYKKK